MQDEAAAVYGAFDVRLTRRVPGDRQRQARPLARCRHPTGRDPTPGAHIRGAETPVEQTLASIWSEILGVARIGLDDDFFDLGGHSLLAVKMLARVQESFDLDLFLHSVFEHATVRELAAAITTELFDTADADELSSLLAEVEGAD